MASRVLVGLWFLAVTAGAVHAQALPGDSVNVSRARGNSSSPTAVAAPDGRFHVAWIDNPGSDDLSQHAIYYARSDEGGFEQPRRLSAGVDEGRREREVRIAASATGLVVVAWWADGQDGDRNRRAVFVATSRDGGETFAPAATTSLEFGAASVAKEGFSNTTSLSLALGPDGEIYLLATVPDYKDGFNVYFARSTDGETFASPRRLSSYQYPIPRATSNALGVFPDGEIYATWTDAVGDFFEHVQTIYLSVSKDGGRTFSAPEPVRGAKGAVAALDVGESTTLLLTQVKRTPSSTPTIKVNLSSDRGRAFRVRKKVGRSPGHSHLHQASVVRSGGVVAVAWAENSPRPTPEDGLWVAISRDDGRTFEAPRIVARGLFAEPPAVVVDASGRVGLFASSPAVSVVDREVVFVSAEP